MVTFPFPFVSTEETSPPAGVVGAADSDLGVQFIIYPPANKNKLQSTALSE